MSKPTLDGCAVLPALVRRVPEPNQPHDRQRNRLTRDRFSCINALVDGSLRDLSRAEVTTWLILWRDTKPNGLARTSQTDLARRAGTDPRTVRRAIKKLVKGGLLTVVHRGGLRRGMSSYRVRGMPP